MAVALDERTQRLHNFFVLADELGYPSVTRLSLLQAVYGPVATYETVSDLAIHNLTEYVRLAHQVTELTKRGQRDNQSLAEIWPEFGRKLEAGRMMSRKAIKDELKVFTVLATVNGTKLSDYINQLKASTK